MSCLSMKKKSLTGYYNYRHLFTKDTVTQFYKANVLRSKNIDSPQYNDGW